MHAEHEVVADLGHLEPWRHLDLPEPHARRLEHRPGVGALARQPEVMHPERPLGIEVQIVVRRQSCGVVARPDVRELELLFAV